MEAQARNCKMEDSNKLPGMHAIALPTQYDNIYFCDNPMVELKIGANLNTFQIHKGLICESSPFFRAAFTGGFKENTGSITLEEDDADLFGHIVQWLYRGKLVDLSKPEADTGGHYWMQLLQLYVLAEKYHMVQLKNDVMDLLFTARYRRFDGQGRKTHRPPQMDHVTYVYENTIRGSQLRRFIVAYYVWQVDLDWFKLNTTLDKLENLSAFGAELTKAFALREKGEECPFFDRPSFHENSRDQIQPLTASRKRTHSHT